MFCQTPRAPACGCLMKRKLFTFPPSGGLSPGVVMKISNCVVGSIVVTTTVAGANAAFLGITGTNYQVVDGSRQFSVMDIYADFNGNYDKLVNYYGNTTHTGLVMTSLNGVSNTSSALVPSNGAAFAQATGTGWMPSASAASNAWDSFVTIGARTQDYTPSSSITADPNFLNGNTNGASTVAGGSNLAGAYQGAGWYTAAPLDIADLAGT